MRNVLLAAPIMATAFLLQACTGGRLEDGSGNPLNVSSTYQQYQVQFQNVSSGEVYTTGVASNGDFAFDPFAPGTASNNATVIPAGSYQISVTVGGGYKYSSPFNVTEAYDTQGCTDTYTGQFDKSCAIYRLQLLAPVNNFQVVPAAPVSDGLITTVQLAGPVLPVTITYAQVGACNGTAWQPLGADVPYSDATADYAKVVFQIQSVSNPGVDAFSFNPANLYIQTPNGQFHFNSNLDIYSYLFGPFGVAAATVPPYASNSNVGGYGAANVYVNNGDPASVADRTQYSLSYAGQVGDPPIILVKSNASQTSFLVGGQETQNCLYGNGENGNDGQDNGEPALSQDGYFGFLP